MGASESVQKVESGPSFEVWTFQSRTVRVDWTRAGIVVTTINGHGHAELGTPCLRCWTEALRKAERVTLLIDFWDMPGYESQLRISMTDWALQHRARLEPIHMLSRSPIVNMGIAVANLALGGLIKTYKLRTSYDLAIQHLGAPGAARGRGEGGPPRRST